MLITLFFITLFIIVLLAWKGHRNMALSLFSITLLLATGCALMDMTSAIEIVL